jgi:hypothetical protein
MIQNVLLEKGYVYKGSHSGWYAVSDECFYTPSQIQDGPGGDKVSLSPSFLSHTRRRPLGDRRRKHPGSGCRRELVL